MFFDGLFVLAVAGSLIAFLLISVPLTGALVRVRANYNPKGLQLDLDGNPEPHTGPVVTSFVGMLKRVKRIEGWAGLYKGIMPTLLEMLILTTFALTVLRSDSPRFHGPTSPPESGPIGALIYSIVATILTLPGSIIAYRSIVTPYRLPYWNPVYSLRILLTPTERRRPWVLYLTPGLFLSHVLHLSYNLLVMRGLKHFLAPNFPARGSGSPLRDVNLILLGILIAIQLLSTAIMCPLEVIITKLSIQRNHAAAEYNSVDQEVEDDDIVAEEYAERTGAEEDVIGLRHDKDPYLGLIDCARRVVNEEGSKALFRVWWLTALAGVGHVFG